MSPRRVPRPAALRRLPLDRHGVIDASAGTGKTFTLENLVVELVVGQGVTLEEILVVTFTERATNELRVRIRGKIEGLLAGQGPEATEAEILAGDCWTLDEQAVGRLARALTSFDGTSISTIHAFCQRVLRDNAFASGRLFDEQQVDARDTFGRAFRDVLRRDVAGNPARAPWLEVALHAGWSLGSLEDLLWKCAEAKGEVLPRFDPARLEAALAAFPVDDALRADGREALRRVGVDGRRLKAVAQKISETALAVARSRDHGGAPGFVMEAEAFEPFTLVAALSGIDDPSPMGRVCRAALEIAEATPSLAGAVPGVILGPVQAELARRKRRAGQYDFDDMLRLLADALSGAASVALAASLRRRFRFALVDEFQDTDETQWQIFRRAFFHPEAEPRTVVFLVGDPKQSIYRFRGADVQTYEAARDEVLRSGGTALRLDTSFRATANLVAAHNAIFDGDAPEPFFTGSGGYAPVACGRPDRVLVDGEGRLVTPVHLFRFEREVASASLGALVAREIRAITDPARPWKLDGKPLGHDDVFVLTRTGAEGRAMGDALRTGGVPHAFYKEDGLFATDEARDIRTLLAAIDDPGDRGRRISAWMTPFFGLPLEHLERAREVPPGHDFVTRLQGWKTMADGHDYERLFERIVVESRVVRRQIFFADGERALTNTLHVFEALLEHARRERVTLRDLVVMLAGLADRTRQPLDMEGNVQRLESDRRAVQIMTIHKSKGLEAAIVFVAGGWSFSASDRVHVGHLDGRRFAWVGPQPDAIKALTTAEEREEHQRLMYVALTRAKGRLYLPSVVQGAKLPGAKRKRADASPDAAVKLRGGYDTVNRRLAALSGSPLFSSEVAPPASVPSPAPSNDASLAAWSPPGNLLAVRDEHERFRALREARAGALLTSYTRMKGSASGARGAWDEDAEARRVEKAAREVVAEGDEAAVVPLRSARASGVFVHELLEQVPLGSFAPALERGGLATWRADPGIADLVARAMSVHRVDPAQREHAERMVWSAYTTPIALPGGAAPLEGLARASRIVREMDFVFPVAGPAAAYVRGSIDLAFEHRGLTYFVDWKTDSLPGYEADALARHVARHYEEQLELYALATVKLLGITSRAEHEGRFGGLLYVFLRGLEPGGEGICSAKPAWADVEAWDRALGVRARRA